MKQFQHLTFIPLAFIILTAFMLLAGCSMNSVPERLTPAETLSAHNNGAFIVDIRAEEDFDQFHIPKAVNIPVTELSDRLDEIPTDSHVILVCTLGRSSMEARAVLTEAGYSAVSSMEGGMMAWYDSGYPGIFNTK
jgi:rhodanese-related sulfurtransferase